LRKANAPAAPRRSARGAVERELAAPVLSGMLAEPVAEPVARLPVAERERVAEETVPLWLAVTAPVPVAEAALETMLEIMLETEAEAEAAEEADEALEAMTEETE
jgi:hypothetical protein